MADLAAWTALIGLGKALLESLTSGIKLTDALIERRTQEDSTRQEAEDALARYSTYSQGAIQSTIDRLKFCEQSFIAVGDGPARKRCICFILDNLRLGNGGEMPDVEPFPDLWERMRCTAE